MVIDCDTDEFSRDGARLHHIGFVVASIERVAERFALAVSADWDGRVIQDPRQRVRVAFLAPAARVATQIELVEPDESGSTVDRFLQRGGGLHHLCFEVEDIAAALNAARAMGSLIVSGPTPAAAFDGRPIAWVYSKDRLLIEYLQRTHLAAETRAEDV